MIDNAASDAVRETVLDTVPETAGKAAAAAPSPDVEEATLRLSFSRVDTYQTCPLKYRFGYEDKLPAAPSPHLSWGSSLHAALETWWDQKLPEPPPVEVLLQALYDQWDDAGFEDMPREEKIRWYRWAQDVLRRHHERHAESFVPPVATEQWFELGLDEGLTVVGSIDHVTRTPSGGLGIVDWKTNRKAKPRERVKSSLQLAIYAMAAEDLWGQTPEWVALDFVVPGVRVMVGRDEIDTDGAREQIREVAAAIRAEQFPPTPSRLCDWCDYRSVCPAFEGEGPDLPGLAVVELRRLRRRHERDRARISELEALIHDRLGPEASVTVSGGEGVSR